MPAPRDKNVNARRQLCNFQDARRAACNYDFNLEPSKSCIIIYICCCCFSFTLLSFTTVTVIVPEYSVYFERLFTIFPSAMQPTNVHLNRIEFMPKPARTRPPTKPKPTTTTTLKTTTTEPPTTRKRTPSTRGRNPLKPLFQIGAGIAPMTGPPVGYQMMGHFFPKQLGAGIHTRQYSRAFCFSEGNKRVIYVVADLFAVGYNVRNRVINALKRRMKDISIANVHIVATGTCNTPGCHLAEFFFGIDTAYQEQCAQKYVDGIKKSIEIACKNLEDGHMFVREADVYYGAVQRNPRQYNWNDNSEREIYLRDYDYTLTQLRLENNFYDLIGIINWLPVRASVSGTLDLMISTDTYGYASMKLEDEYNVGKHKLPGQGKFIAAFAPSNHADLSAHIGKGICRGSPNWRCSFRPECVYTSFWGIPQYDYWCAPHREGVDDVFVEMATVGERIYVATKDALDVTGEELRGSLEVSTMNLKSILDNCTRYYDSAENRFVEIKLRMCTTPFLSIEFLEYLPYDDEYPKDYDHLRREIVAKLQKLGGTPPDTQDCHYPKKVISSYGRGLRRLHPYDWTVSTINFGGLLIGLAPASVTTMAGRRMKKIMETEQLARNHKAMAVVSSHANEYILFVATYNEYRSQFHEASGTVSGSHTGDAVFCMLRQTTVNTLGRSNAITHHKGLEGESGHHLRTKNVNRKPVVNIPPRKKYFGLIEKQPPRLANKGDAVKFSLISSNPNVSDRDDEGGYWKVERQESDKWIMVASDADFSTRLEFSIDTMVAKCTWATSPNETTGIYRFKYTVTRNDKDYMIITDSFTVK